MEASLEVQVYFHWDEKHILLQPEMLTAVGYLDIFSYLLPPTAFTVWKMLIPTVAANSVTAFL